MSKYIYKDLISLVESSTSLAEVARKIGIKPATGSASYLGKKIRKLNLDTSHFVGCAWRKNKIKQERMSVSEVLILRDLTSKRQSGKTLRRALLESGRKLECEECDLGTMWNGKPITLAIDHKNGLIYDDRAENLRFLCPNCHTQTDNYCSKSNAKEKAVCKLCNEEVSRKNQSGYCWKCFNAIKRKEIKLAAD